MASDNNEQSQSKDDITKKDVDFKKHWNRDWKDAHVEAARTVEEMIKQSEQGLIVVAKSTPEWTRSLESEKDKSKHGFGASMKDTSTKKREFGDYWLHVMKCKQIEFNGESIDGNSLRDSAEKCTEKSCFDEAALHLQQALQLVTITFEPNHPYFGDFYHNLGLAYYCKRRYSDAIVCYEKALDVRKKTFGTNHPGVAQLYHNLGLTYDSKRKYRKALKSYKWALKIRNCLLRNTHSKVSDSFVDVKIPCDNTSERFQNMTLKIKMDVFGISYADVAWSYNNIGTVYDAMDNFEKAMKCYEQSLKIRQDMYGPDHYQVAHSYDNIGITYYNRAQYDKALENSEKALQIRLRLFGTNHQHVIDSYNSLGAIFRRMKQYDKAIESYNHAIDITKTMLGNLNRNVGDLNWYIGGTFEEKGETEMAIKYYEKAWTFTISLWGRGMKKQ
ncbi:hypothetical protein RFI_21850 [Reticulomyxa filosa]|uniref:Uncharacterized protein n=1 Tax=Reticulomyxa filosa TaxID=46433 RepID=X6MQ04_RETFI|nr:hypothetical protein RFI_21850 [Reticulomyxa filosa]|eukprot:ETO15512.1 hypothetical protein RFI_21850 [Reticulomyxa filosa]